MAAFRYVCFAVLMTACLSASADTKTKPVSVDFNGMSQSSASLQDGVAAFFTMRSAAESMTGIATGRNLLQGDCNPGFKVCDNIGCIPQANTCCNDGDGSSCKPSAPVCVPNTNKCAVSAGNMAQAKIGMVLVSLATFVLGMLMI